MSPATLQDLPEARPATIDLTLGSEQLTAKPTGRSWATDWAMVWTVRDGKVAWLREYHETDAIAAAYR